MCPKTNRFAGTLTPVVRKVVEVMAKGHGKPIQFKDAVLSSRSKLPTQILQRLVFTGENLRISKLAI